MWCAGWCHVHPGTVRGQWEDPTAWSSRWFQPIISGCTLLFWRLNQTHPELWTRGPSSRQPGCVFLLPCMKPGFYFVWIAARLSFGHLSFSTQSSAGLASAPLSAVIMPAVSLMCTPVPACCFTSPPCFVPGVSARLRRSVHHLEDTLREPTQKHEQLDAEPHHPPLILILCNLSSLNSSFLRLDYIIIQ